MAPRSKAKNGGEHHATPTEPPELAVHGLGRSWIQADEIEEYAEETQDQTSIKKEDQIGADDFELLQQSREPPRVALEQLSSPSTDATERRDGMKSEPPIALQQTRQPVYEMSSSAYDMVDDKSQLLMPAIDHTADASQSPTYTPGRKAGSTKNSPLRQRRGQTEAVSTPVQATYRKVSSTPASSSKKKRQQQHRQEENNREGTVEHMWNGLTSLLGDSLGRAMRLIKTPLSWVMSGLIVYLISWALLRGARNKAQSMATGVICRVPFVSVQLFPDICSTDQSSARSSGPLPPAEFDRLMASNAHLEELISSKAEAVALPAIMKRSEASIRDVRTLVTASTLRSRGQLLLELDAYVDSSRLAVRDLSQFHSHVDRAADNILYTARWTRRVLGDIESERTIGGSSDSSNGALIQNSFLRSLFGLSQLTTPEQAILARYVEHAEAVEGQIHRLLLEAEALYLLLQHLDDRLDVLGSIAARDGGVAEVGRADVLAELWTRLGGNRRKIARYDHELAILRQVDLQRRLAMDQVGDAVVRLRSMEAELAGLRERVGAARLTGAGAGSEAHGVAAVPISLHLENIERGVHRLEAVRDDSRRRFDEFQEKAWSSSRAGAGADGAAFSDDQDVVDGFGVTGGKKHHRIKAE